MSVFICPDCGSSHEIFGAGGARQEADTLGVPFLGEAPLHLSVRESGDNGVPIASSQSPQGKTFEAIAARFLAAL